MVLGWKEKKKRVPKTVHVRLMLPGIGKYYQGKVQNARWEEFLGRGGK